MIFNQEIYKFTFQPNFVKSLLKFNSLMTKRTIETSFLSLNMVYEKIQVCCTRNWCQPLPCNNIWHLWLRHGRRAWDATLPRSQIPCPQDRCSLQPLISQPLCVLQYSADPLTRWGHLAQSSLQGKLCSSPSALQRQPRHSQGVGKKSLYTLCSSLYSAKPWNVWLTLINFSLRRYFSTGEC